MLRGNKGQGMAASTERSITNGPAYPHSTGGNTDGENSTVSGTYSASIKERENKSNPRNQGPVRAESVVATNALPIATKGGRKTGKV